ncbi:MAG: C25 family cysteine peptidase [Chlamydiota bacterium]
MKIFIDPSALIAVIADEPHTRQLIEMTRGAGVPAPSSVRWGIGNAFSEMCTRNRSALARAAAAARARFCGVVVCVAAVIAAPTAYGRSGGAVDARVTRNAADGIEIRYTIGAFSSRTVTIDGAEHRLVALPGESAILARGAPSLPRVCRSVVIPDDAEMSVRVVSAEYHDLTGVLLAPSKGNIYRTTDPSRVPYTIGDAYRVDAWYPAELASLREPYVLRDRRGVVVELHPLRYNPVTETLRVYTAVTLEVAPAGAGRINVLDRRTAPRKPSAAFERIYGRHFLNGEGARMYDPPDEEGGMLIICHDAWLANIQPLVDHKNARGIPTTAVGVAAIGNDADSIKDYIRGVYDGGTLSFVLLVGDAAQIAAPEASGGASDPSYAKLAGGDDYPDILVGRFSAESGDDVDTQVRRTIDYETVPSPSQAWFSRGTGIGSEYGTGDDGEYDWEHIDNIRADLLNHGYTPVDQIYGAGATDSQVSVALNAGRGIVNYCGHGSMTSWGTTGFSNSDVNALTNNNELPFIFSVACVNGAFTSGTCFAEAWLRARHDGEPTGAIAAYMSSINQSWEPPMIAQDESNDLLVADAYFSFGALCYAGSCRMMDEAGSAGVEMFDTWHVFGDPSLLVGTVEPPVTPTPTPTPTPPPTPAPTPAPTFSPPAEMALNGSDFSRGDHVTATFVLRQSIERPFCAYAAVVLPDGSMRDAATLGAELRPVAPFMPALGAPFRCAILSAAVPGAAPEGGYEVVVAFFDAFGAVRGRPDAFLDASARFAVR